MKRIVSAFVLLALCPPVALAQTGARLADTSPIAVTTCQLYTGHNQMGFGNVFFNGHANHFFKVSFTNDGRVAADHVVFQVDFSQSRYVIGDRGSFAPGVNVTNIFRDHGKDIVASKRPPGSNGSTQCAVLSVHFTDGTTWTAPTPEKPGAF